jgi:hypothetical protein
MMASEAVQRCGAMTVSVATLALLMSPIRQNWSEQPTDGFPLSYYPMFTSQRGETTTIHHAVGITSEGGSVNIPGRYAGPGGMNTVRVQMRRMCFDGRAAKLAKRVAERFSGSSFAEQHKIQRVDIVQDEYAIERYFDGETEPVSREVAASARLARRSAP